MKKSLLLITLPFMFFITLSAQITQEHADLIILGHLPNDTSAYTLYAKDTVQPNYVVLTATNEKLKLNYPCLVYYVSFTGETDGKYLIVKESNGNVLEVNAKNDEGPDDLEEWREVPNIPHSVWKCTKVQDGYGQVFYLFIELSFYPSIGKLIIKSDEEISWSGVYDYYLDEIDRLYLTPDIFSGLAWYIIFQNPEDEMILTQGMMLSTKFYFICLTEFNDI